MVIEHLKTKSILKPAIRDVYEDKTGLVPFNFPLTEIQSAIGSKLLKRLSQLNKTREKDFLNLKIKWKNLILLNYKR